jgi:hypothetical protein
MITNAELQEKHGEDIVFLFKGDEPYTEALGNPLGVLIERDDKVLCFECETWHERLSGPPHQSHIWKAHKLTADEYKEKWGFNYSAPLCSRKVSETMREKSLKYIEENPEVLDKLAKHRNKGYRTRKANGFRTRGKKSMQHSNSRASCPEQIKQRYRLLQAKYGSDVSVNVIRVTDPYVESWAVRHFGSWNAFKKELGEPTKEGGPAYQKQKADLIYDLRLYVEKHNKLPWDVHTKRPQNDFPHSVQPYETQWGTLSNAYLICGINSQYFNNNGHAEKRWSIEPGWQPDPEYMEAAKESKTRLQARAVTPLEKNMPVVNSEVKIIKPATTPVDKISEAVKQQVLEETVDEQIESVVHYGLVTPDYQVGPTKPKLRGITLTDKGKKVLGRPVAA